MSYFIAKCDGCGERARKRSGHPCPDHWFYLESTRQSDRSVYVVWACSETCRTALWERGPGPANIDEAASRRSIDRRAQRARDLASSKKGLTFAELKAELDKMTPEQLAAPAVWCGDERGGYIKEVYVHAEDWIGDPGDHETYLPRSEALKQYGADDLENMVVCVPVGTVYLMVD